MKIALRLLILFLFILSSKELSAQDVYRTPYGERYHLGSCHNVRNVSHRLKNADEIKRLGLTPCKQCKPPLPDNINFNNIHEHKEVGMLKYAVQCSGTTLKRVRCKRRTKIGNGYCFQHQEQAPKRQN